MLLAIREKLTGWVLVLIVMLLAVPFALFGINNYFEAQVDRFAAKVNETEIDPQVLQERLEIQRRQMRQMFGADTPLDFLNTPENKRRVLDELIDEELRKQDALAAGINIPASKLQESILAIDAFKPAGVFDQDTYVAVLRNNGLTPQIFEQRMAGELLAQEIVTRISATAIVTQAELDAYLRTSGQSRSFRNVILSSADQALETEIDDAAIQKHYEDNAETYRTPERVVIEYVEVSAAKLDIAPPSEDDLIKQYESQASRFVVPEQRLTSHVLVQVGANADAEAQRETLAKAEALLAEVRGGKDFAEVASSTSDDLGSKGQGGDLGWLERGTVDQAFEDALFALEVGQVSEPVLGSDGFHLIQLREVKPESRREFDEVRAELLSEYDSQERSTRYNQLAGRLVDAINRDPLSLEGPAGSVGLTVQRTEPFDRQMGGAGIAGNRQVVDAAYSDMVLVRGQTSDLVDIGRDHAVALRVVERLPAEPRPLDTVREEIISTLRSETQRARLKVQMQAHEQRLAAGETLDTIAAELEKVPDIADGVVRTAGNIDPSLLEEVFKLPRPTEGMPLLRALSLGEDRYALVELSSVVDPDPATVDATAREAARTQLQTEWSQAEARAYVKALRSQAKIRIDEERVR